MRHLLTKFVVAVTVFGALLWLGLQREQERLSRIVVQAAELSQKGK